MNKRLPNLFTFRFSLFTAAALALTLALCAGAARAETVDIASAADWASFAGRVNAGETNLGAKLTADVALGQSSPFVGDAESHAYAGTFEGDGHTLTVNWKFTDGTQWVAPFKFANACKIHNLHVAGALESNGKFVASFVAKCVPNGNGNYTSITNCRSSAAITCTISGDSTSAGFVGHVENSGSAKVEIRDGLFDGSLLGPTATSCGGFVGYRPGPAYSRLYNCLFDPAEVTLSPNNSYTFSRGGYDTLDKCYYVKAFGDTQNGRDATSMFPSEIVDQLGPMWTVVNGKAGLKLFAVPAVPPVPAVEGFTYQGAIQDLAGDPVSGERTVEFRIYEQPTGGSALWGRSRKVLLDANGLFTVELSDGVGEGIPELASTGLGTLIASSSSPLYVGITVSGTDGEVAPRQRLLSVPYASYASDAAGAAGDFAIAGRLDAARLDVSGRSTVSGNATVKGDASVRGNLAVAGKILAPGGSRAAYGTAPVGVIVLWSGAANRVPDGWALCDGSNGTPDLRGRFVVGYDAGDSDYSSPGKTGGEKRHTLSVGEMPAHTHDNSVKTVGYALSYNGSAEAATHDGHDRNNGWKTIKSASAGGGQSHENRPPYYALCYIMRVK